MRLVLLILPTIVQGCSVFDYHTLSSGLNGVVVDRGVPVEGVKITFKAISHWYGENNPQTYITKSDGRFIIKEWNKFSLLTPLHQPVIEQVLIIEYEGNKYIGWKATKMSYTGYAYEDGPFNVVCELSSPVSTYNIYKHGVAEGICTIYEKET